MMTEQQEVWVVTVEQAYANHYSVVGVCSTLERAEEMAKKHPDSKIESYYIDVEW